MSSFTHIVIMFLIFTILSSSHFISSNANNYTTFVKNACNTTTYPALCRKTCLPDASKIAGDDRKLANSALSATLTAANSAASAVTRLSRRKDLGEYEAKVVRDCIENMGDSIDDLKQSIDQLNDLGGESNVDDSNNVKFKISNIKTWMSACITNENTCMDELKEGKVSQSVKDKIRRSTLGVARRTSNALSLCNHLQ